MGEMISIHTTGSSTSTNNNRLSLLPLLARHPKQKKQRRHSSYNYSSTHISLSAIHFLLLMSYNNVSVTNATKLKYQYNDSFSLQSLSSSNLMLNTLSSSSSTKTMVSKLLLSSLLLLQSTQTTKTSAKILPKNLGTQLYKQHQLSFIVVSSSKLSPFFKFSISKQQRQQPESKYNLYSGDDEYDNSQRRPWNIQKISLSQSQLQSPVPSLSSTTKTRTVMSTARTNVTETTTTSTTPADTSTITSTNSTTSSSSSSFITNSVDSVPSSIAFSSLDTSKSIQESSTLSLGEDTSTKIGQQQQEQLLVSQPKQSNTKTTNAFIASTASFGDIMDGLTTTTTSSTPDSSSSSITTSTSTTNEESNTSSVERVTSLVTSSLVNKYNITNPLDRMLLTANGNLQRLVSSYYDSPVSVIVDHCTIRPVTSLKPTNTLEYDTTTIDAEQGSILTSTAAGTIPTIPDGTVWDRTVRLQVYNTTFCIATSIITVYDPYCQQLVQSNQIGLGQLFRFLNILPEFVLHNAGIYNCNSNSNSHNNSSNTAGTSTSTDTIYDGFWRVYTLQCKELSCYIREEFISDLWNISSTE